MRHRLFVLLIGGLMTLSLHYPVERTFEVRQRLSDYGFFSGKMSDLKPVEGVIPYDLNTPLFSDYAFKQRFIKVPEGSQARYTPLKPFEFPIGTILIKNFYYPSDFRKPEKHRKIIETRLLVREESELGQAAKN